MFKQNNKVEFNKAKKSYDEFRKAVQELEAEIRKRSNEKMDAEKTHHENRMSQSTEEELEREFNERHDLYVRLITKQIEDKKDQVKGLDKELADMAKAFGNWKQYQDFMKEIARLEKEIEEAIVKGEFLSI